MKIHSAAYMYMPSHRIVVVRRYHESGSAWLENVLPGELPDIQLLERLYSDGKCALIYVGGALCWKSVRH